MRNITLDCSKSDQDSLADLIKLVEWRLSVVVSFTVSGRHIRIACIDLRRDEAAIANVSH
jgi:hypothetical protein